MRAVHDVTSQLKSGAEPRIALRTLKDERQPEDRAPDTPGWLASDRRDRPCRCRFRHAPWTRFVVATRCSMHQRRAALALGCMPPLLPPALSVAPRDAYAEGKDRSGGRHTGTAREHMRAEDARIQRNPNGPPPVPAAARSRSSVSMSPSHPPARSHQLINRRSFPNHHLLPNHGRPYHHHDTYSLCCPIEFPILHLAG